MDALFISLLIIFFFIVAGLVAKADEYLEVKQNAVGRLHVEGQQVHHGQQPVNPDGHRRRWDDCDRGSDW